jgi:hypothetical protein
MFGRKAVSTRPTSNSSLLRTNLPDLQVFDLFRRTPESAR